MKLGVEEIVEEGEEDGGKREGRSQLSSVHSVDSTRPFSVGRFPCCVSHICIFDICHDTLTNTDIKCKIMKIRVS